MGKPPRLSRQVQVVIRRTPMPQMRQAWEAVLDRVGWTPRERLAWVVRAVGASELDRTPGDWANLCAELAVFAGQGPRGGGARFDGAELLDQPDRETARAILLALEPLLQKAVERKPVLLDREVVNPSLEWKGGRFQPKSVSLPLREKGKRPNARIARAKRVLGQLLQDSGHLLKVCPAQRPREAEPCGAWFVATRPRQAYCSPTCQSRDATQRWRREA